MPPGCGSLLLCVGHALFLGFAFTVMADPVSSVAYAIEATLRGLDGDLGSLFPTMAVVVAIIAIVSATYDQLIRRFPGGGGGPEGVAGGVREGWASCPSAPCWSTSR